jgi:hypothetical protein
MKITADDEKLLVGDQKGHLNLISSRDGEVIKDSGRAHECYITRIVITADHRFFFISSYIGNLEQRDYKAGTLVMEHGNIKNNISSLCL